MLTKPRLSLFKPKGLGQRLRHGMMEKTLGMVPAALHVELPRTRMDRRAFAESKRVAMRTRSAWSRGQRECLAAFVSWLNHCRF